MKLFLTILKFAGLGFLALIFVGFVLLLFDNNKRNSKLTEEQLKNLPIVKKYESKFDSTQYYDLLKKFGKDKKLPYCFEMQALLALSHYPQLADVPIDFLVQDAMIPLSSRPNPFHLFQPWRTRRYLVVISSKSWKMLEPILLKNLPFDEQVGVLGHELAHTVYYLDKSALKIVGAGLSYPFAAFRKKFERDTDKRAIAHGLGYQLFSYATFVRQAFSKDGKVPESFENAEESYLSPKEIAEEMKKHPMFYDKF